MRSFKCWGLLLTLFIASHAAAATIVVNSTDQEPGGVTNGNCTLGEAIMAATYKSAQDTCTAGTGDDTIELQANATYTLMALWKENSDPEGLPRIGGNTKIIGNGSIIVRDINAPAFRIFSIWGKQVVLENLTIKNGLVADNDGGAGIYSKNNESLTLSNVTLLSNTGTSILNLGNIYFGSKTIISGSTFKNNSATQYGTIISTSGTDSVLTTLTIDSSDFTGNTSQYGFISATGTAVTLQKTIFLNNKGEVKFITANLNSTLNIQKTSFIANSSQNGLILLNTEAGSATVAKSLFSGNLDIGIVNHSLNPVIISDSTFTENKSGAISNSGTNLSLINITIANNTAASGSGGIYGSGIKAVTSITNSIIINNTPADCVDSSGLIISLGHNIWRQGGGCPTSAGDIVTKPTDNVLAKLVFDPTTPGLGYFPLSPLSMAINTGDTCINCPATDQIGWPRDAKYDIGAIEAKCGDGNVHTILGEECDDNNYLNNDGCGSNCKIESGYNCIGNPSICDKTCGNGILNYGEYCDDNNIQAGDGCSSSCKIENGYSCFIIAPSTKSDCYKACGNGQNDGGTEECDDFNNNSGDGCSAICKIEAGYSCSGTPSICKGTCGNGKIELGEKCDDNNINNKDGCSSTCQVEPEFTCTGDPSFCAAICGDGKEIDGHEQCDDGNTNNGDGCSSNCMVEAHYTCIPNDFAPTNCVAKCGDNYLLPGEECDDGNWFDGDGCNHLCKKEVCGDGIAQTGIKELCDGSDLAKKDCSSINLGFDGGILSCNTDCTFNTAQCTNTPKESCGDGIKNGVELCDKTDLGKKTCTSLGLEFEGGSLSCNPDCTVNVSACVKPKGSNSSGGTGTGATGSTTTPAPENVAQPSPAAPADAAPASGGSSGGGCSLIR